ncbi:MAG: D-aminoacyl-tRNA deacylase [Actinomycetota bacterium]|nr:D-aminoacyl-tRNA deacylase [Actinomycetota bacterium]
MRAVVQRVSKASVEVEGRVLARIERGLVVLLAIAKDDAQADIDYMVDKITNLRIFEREGKFDLSVKDVGGEILLISQFTLYGDTKKGRRPSFTDAAPPIVAKELYEIALKKFGDAIQTKGGEFQAHMSVNIVNDGPVTIIIDSKRNL